MSDKADVTVDRNGVVSVSDQELKPHGNNKKLEWTMVSGEWRFASDGIVVEGNDGQFIDPGMSGNAKKFWITDLNTNAKTYKYTITVHPIAQPHDRKVLDPTIKNGETFMD